MKSLRTVLSGLVVVGMIVFFSGVSFAQDKSPDAKAARHEARIKLLKDSAAALQQSNPVLAKGLLEMAEGQQKAKEAKESAEWKAKHEARVKLLKDSAAALQKSNPDLAKSLEEMTVPKHKTEMQQMMQEKNEKEEMGEKAEPKSEQGETK